MSIFSKIFGGLKSKKAAPTERNPKPKYIHYGQRANPDAKRRQKFGPKKD